MTTEITPALPTHDALYAYLKAHYMQKRFEGMADRDWPDYAGIVTEGKMADLTERGWGMIASHESVTGERIIFDTALQELPGIPD